MAANPEQIKGFMKLGGAALLGLYFLNSCRFTVEPGHTAVKFSKFTGLGQFQYKEGWHLRLPYFEYPVDFNVQTRPKQIKAATANKDMQNVIVTLRVLFRPSSEHVTQIYRNLGLDYDEKVLPSIVNETLRSVIAQYSASQLLTQRDQVSQKIRRALQDRAQYFNIVIDDVSITDLTFGKEYLEAVEAKQVAQQEAERAKFTVEQAREKKKSIIIKAQGDAKAIELVGKAALSNPAYLDLRKIEYSKEIGALLSESRNHIMLPSDILCMYQPPQMVQDKQ